MNRNRPNRQLKSRYYSCFPSEFGKSEKSPLSGNVGNQFCPSDTAWGSKKRFCRETSGINTVRKTRAHFFFFPSCHNGLKTVFVSPWASNLFFQNWTVKTWFLIKKIVRILHRGNVFVNLSKKNGLGISLVFSADFRTFFNKFTKFRKGESCWLV